MKISAIPFQEAVKMETIVLPLAVNNPVTTQEFFSYLSRDHQKILAAFADANFKAEEWEIKSLWLGCANPQRIVLVGLGNKKWHERKYPLLPRQIIQLAKKETWKECCIVLPEHFLKDINPAPSQNTPQLAGGMTPSLRAKMGMNGCHFNSSYGTQYPEGRSGIKDIGALYATNILMADFQFNRYKEKNQNAPRLERVMLAIPHHLVAMTEKEIHRGIIIGEETNRCRALANTPGGDMTPALLATDAVAVAKRTGMKATIFDEKKMKQLGMGAIVGVGRGSDAPPRFIILEYLKGPKNQKPLVLVGKGVTFDTGGLNLKPDQYIYEMHMDMSGGAAVIHGIAAIARLKLPVNIIGLVPAVENMPSGSSYRPGDQLKSMSGKTIEVLNTDAEGRVILADALTYGLRYKPEIMIDLATLTGAAHVALGNYCSAVFSNDEKLQNHLVELGKTSGDYLWPLPLWDEFLSEIKGTFGDLANTGVKDRYGGASHGAKFLEQFAGNTRFAHLDIAPRMTANDSEFLSKGALGTGVRLIAELGKHYPHI